MHESEMTETAIERSVLADQVRDRLLGDILSGRYAPESRIVETRVAREMGTSQAPVREALRSLEALGVIDILPFRGARVRRTSHAEILEAYEVRAELETLGARLGVPVMTDDDLRELEELHAAMQAATREGDRHEIAARDAAFHARILHTAANATLERVWRSLEPYSRTYITLIAPGADPAWTAGLHDPILRALQARNVAQVEAALCQHFRLASEHLAAGWRDSGDPGEAGEASHAGHAGGAGDPA